MLVRLWMADMSVACTNRTGNYCTNEVAGWKISYDSVFIDLVICSWWVTNPDLLIAYFGGGGLAGLFNCQVKNDNLASSFKNSR